MTNIIEFKPGSGLKKVNRKKDSSCDDKYQLDLFPAGKNRVNVFSLPSNLSPFEEALILDEHKVSGAKEAYMNAVTSNDCVADAYCNLGIIEYESGNTIKAIDLFTKSLASDPRHLESHFNMANLYSELGNLLLAKTHYEIAKEIKPDFPDLYYNLGLVYAMTRDFKSAINILSEYKSLVSPKEAANADKLIRNIKKLTG